MPRTAIVVPCYNEADGIPQLAARLAPVLCRLGEDVEVIFVDDGSTDETARLINREAQGIPHRIIRHERNRGLGAALKTGFAHAEADEIVTIDSDCTYDPEEIIDLLGLLRHGYDIVTGSPYHPSGEVVGVPRWRLSLSRNLSYIYWLILPQRLYTYTSCFRAYRREVLPLLRAESQDFLCVTQLLVSGILRGARVVEFPTRLTQRRFGQSKMKILKVIVSHLRYIPGVILERILGPNNVHRGQLALTPDGQLHNTLVDAEMHAHLP
jgi:dolichol-phosphate mannosyltransferase